MQRRPSPSIRRALAAVGCSMTMALATGSVAAAPAATASRSVVTDSGVGWVGARPVGSIPDDDWEPALATDTSAPYVYVLVTRINGEPACRNCPVPPIMLLISKDGGRTFGSARPLCTCRGVKEMFDPQIEVTAGGTVYAAWMNDFHIVFSKSGDHGRTWTKPVPVYLPRRWSDKPILATDASGRDVYVAFNGPSVGDPYIARSHDFGDTWERPVKAVDATRYYFAGGGQVLPDGTIVFSEASERQNSTGTVKIHAITSTDEGATWNDVVVDVVQQQPPCASKGCPSAFYAAGTALAADANGDLVLLYQGALVPEGPQRMLVRRSSDGGATWSTRRALSPAGAIAAFPAAVATGAGDVRVWYMDDRRGPDAWNVWYRESVDGGRTWTAGERISDAVSGRPYLGPHGFAQPYGDYGEIAITSMGRTVAIWGAGKSYAGPGGAWFNRSR